MSNKGQGENTTITTLIFDFYGVVYVNFNWDVVDERIRSNVNKLDQFRNAVNKINHGHLSNDEFRKIVAELAEDDKHPDNPAVYLKPTVNIELGELIKDLKHSYTTVLFSNGTEEHVNQILEDNNLSECFNFIFTSSNFMYKKPSIESYHFVLQQIGSKAKETIMIDDSIRHIYGAQAAGLNTVKFEDIDDLKAKLKEFGV